MDGNTWHNCQGYSFIRTPCYFLLLHNPVSSCPSLNRHSRLVDYQTLENFSFWTEHIILQIALGFLHLQPYHRASNTLIPAKVNLITWFPSWNIRVGNRVRKSMSLHLLLMFVNLRQQPQCLVTNQVSFPLSVSLISFLLLPDSSSQEHIPHTSCTFSPISTHTPLNTSIYEAPNCVHREDWFSFSTLPISWLKDWLRISFQKMFSV